MKVKELIEKLQQCNPDDIVILSKDEEGNEFYVLDKMEKMVYIPDRREVHYGELTQDMEKQGYTKAVVLWP